jgi:hypothetical protein
MALFLVIGSCSDDDMVKSQEFSTSDLPQTWELYFLTTGLSGESLEGDEISFEETYVFRQDGTFSKSYKSDSFQGAGKGTFIVEETGDGELIRLSYDSEIGELSQCSRENLETINISEDSTTLRNVACIAFDGPGLYYQRID